jgi:hypothetical protein
MYLNLSNSINLIGEINLIKYLYVLKYFIMNIFPNPFRPGAGQKPPYLAGRNSEQQEFIKLLEQKPILQNLIITGLRGVGKTVLLEALHPIAINRNWLWCGTDLSESASLSERNLCTRIITDVSSVTASFPAIELDNKQIGFSSNKDKVEITANFHYLMHIYNETPGLESDKLKAVLQGVWQLVEGKVNGIVLAYDEAQILKDQSADKQYPLSLLLEVVQYLQRKQIPYLLVLTGLPTLFPNLVDTRTYAERMFHILHLNRLDDYESKDAIVLPTQIETCPVRFSENAIQEIVNYSGGYPYFIQFLCKETFDTYLFQLQLEITNPTIMLQDIIRKLDTDFYAGRWHKITDKQKELMFLIAELPNADNEFTLSDITEKSKEASDKPLSSSSINQLLIKLVDSGLIYKYRHGKYTFAVPMLSGFIKRQNDY